MTAAKVELEGPRKQRPASLSSPPVGAAHKENSTHHRPTTHSDQLVVASPKKKAHQPGGPVSNDATSTSTRFAEKGTRPTFLPLALPRLVGQSITHLGPDVVVDSLALAKRAPTIGAIKRDGQQPMAPYGRPSAYRSCFRLSTAGANK